jgi:tRNA A37 threonylcarbamoyladenosine dehydratase
LRAILKKTLSINKKAETINFIKKSKKPVISGANQAPKVSPTILYAVSFLLILNIV